MDPELRSALECPICFEVLKTPIYSCSNGHCVCTDCKENIALCPLCRRRIDSRNVVLDNVLELIPQPCEHQSCSQLVKIKNRSDHEKLYHRSIKVVCHHCLAQIGKNQFREHVIDRHGKGSIFDIISKKPLQLSFQTSVAKDSQIVFLNDAATKKLLPYTLNMFFNFNSSRVVVCVMSGEDAKSCPYSVTVWSSSPGGRQWTYRSTTDAVRVCESNVHIWKQLECFTSCTNSLKLTASDKIMVKLTLDLSGPDAGPGSSRAGTTTSCSNWRRGCEREMSLDALSSHLRSCDYRLFICFLCDERMNWVDFWEHLEEDHDGYIKTAVGSSMRLCLSNMSKTEEKLKFVSPDSWYRYHVVLNVDLDETEFSLGVFVWVSDEVDTTDMFTVSITVNNCRDPHVYTVSGIKFPFRGFSGSDPDWVIPEYLSLNPYDLGLRVPSNMEVVVTPRNY